MATATYCHACSSTCPESSHAPIFSPEGDRLCPLCGSDFVELTDHARQVSKGDPHVTHVRYASRQTRNKQPALFIKSLSLPTNALAPHASPMHSRRRGQW